MTKTRCAWADSDPLLAKYHDSEWGRPVRDDRILFELINLEGAQAGLSWLTVLRKRPRYREVFDGFDPAKIARYTMAKKSKLLGDPGIIRNRLKVDAVVENARAFLELRRGGESFADLVWSFVDGQPLRAPDARRGVEISVAMSKALKKRGFRFVGPTICYAFMQAAGLVDDHSPDCFRAPKASRPGGRGSRA